MADSEGSVTTVGLTGYDYYVPETVVTGEEIAEASGIPEEVVVEKMGLVEKRVCPPDEDHATDMCLEAAEGAIAEADIEPTAIDLVLYHGSEFKDHIVWSAAANIADRLGATNAYATESYTLCAGAPVAFRQVTSQLRTGDIETALLVSASREEDLVDYANEDSSFMFNFGSGASAAVLEREPERDRARARVRGSDAITDGSFSEDVVMPAGGSVAPPSHETVDANAHTLDVPDPDGMKERLAEVSLDNYLAVAEGALESSGYETDDIDFVAVTHMKRSFHELLLDRLGVDPGTDGYYLDEYGHVQSVDQILALDEGHERGRVEPGDVVLFLAAGTGYTWAATVLEWLG
ncbi:3-oxoacyl-[acyl-carrier-protein] synthase-3 [Halovenus aranensis]|jgi:3-oxoacyl-[acyl-carrier-protein] synthase-3|uniref:3-oxoacyl-[acyl-carrier-protein] synthase-3 n=1 Tax=Halovenus aranensis TaxID=890420 RepID=A0A1G8YZG7_9EURY|nr:3-oxoacyl-ACP synthase [Halovenus aranensis]SDK08127.1 3-oxoacyl-[acyl-carrier-protein] synthase-3 [Halovenus aranensis]